jgi:localization factor PodJL
MLARHMTIRMQPELPWNVAGIAPEAREAARASARREGLSVGEWLTRRILQSLGEAALGREEWWSVAPVPTRSDTGSAVPAPESADMLAHVSRSENETQNSARRIEDQLKGLARRLEHTERSQSENSRAMTQAASEINIFSREQAQAFDQLGAHVVRLDERLGRIEQLSAGDGTKEAIKALHLGLSRLADQMGDTATRSAAQASQLAENLGTVVGKLAESRDEGRQNWRALEERVAALAANVGSVAGRLLESRDLAERAFRAVDARLSTAEETLGRLDTAQADQSADTAELRRHAVALTQMSESVETLTRRFAAAEGEASLHRAQLDARIEQAEARPADPAIAARLEAAEHRFDTELRGLASRIDTAGQRQRDAVAELGTLVKEISGRVDTARSAPATPASEQSGASRFGLPPFDETARSPAEAASPRPASAGLDSFFASRHGGSGEHGAGAKAFSWTDAPKPHASQNRKIWIILLAALAGLVIAAIVAGAILSRTPDAPPPPAPVVRTPTHSASPAPTKSSAAPAASIPHTLAPVAAPTNAANAEAPAPIHADRSAHAVPAVPGLRTPDQRNAAPPATAKAAPVSPQNRLAALADSGNAKAETLLGIDYVEGRGRPVNEAEGAKWLERAALKGEAVAAWRLGSMYEHGQGVPADAAKSVQWYTVAAKAGNRKAMHNLAVAYAHGSGVTKDLVAASQWFARAAALGLADSQYNLAVLYERGLGVPQNLRAAYTWYAIAAAHGDAGSQARLAALASQISADDKSAAEKAAADFRPDALDTAANSPPKISGAAGG